MNTVLILCIISMLVSNYRLSKITLKNHELSNENIKIREENLKLKKELTIRIENELAELEFMLKRIKENKKYNYENN